MKEIAPRRAQQLTQPVDSEAAYGPQIEEAHLRDYWNVVVKYRRLIISVFAIIFVFGVYIISNATPLYTAIATIKIDPQNPQFIRIEEVLNLQVQSGDYYQTQHELMKSRALAAKVITELGLESNRAFTSIPIIRPDPMKFLSSKFFGMIQSIMNFVSYLAKPSPTKPVQSVSSDQQSVAINTEQPSFTKRDVRPQVNPGYINRYVGFLKIEPVRSTRLVRIVFTTPDPNLSQQLANAHATAFVRMNLETRFEVTKEARKFLEKKLEELKLKVEESEAELAEFRKTHGVVSMDRGENLIVDRMVALNASLTSARIKRIELESLRQMLENKNASELSEVMNNGTIQQYRNAIEILTADQVRLSTVLKPDHPRMIELSTRLNETRQRMKAAIEEIVRRIQTDYVSSRNREVALEAEAARQKQSAIDLKGLGVKYTVLQGEVESNRNLYRNVLARLNETTISSDLPVSNMQITELADTPGYFSSGTEQLKLLMATVGGALFLSLGLAFCLHYFDSRLSTSDDVWRYLYLPTLGVVPDIKSLQEESYRFLPFPKHPVKRLLTYMRGAGAGSSDKELMILAQPASIISECYRTIRTALLFSQPETAPQAVLFTSPGPSEGKTLTTLNLAISLAQSGKSVLLIDADMRKGRCHRLLHRPNDRGLSSILTGQSTVEEGLQETAVPGLSFLSRGIVPPNPPDLLGSSAASEMLNLLRNRFEFILLDGSPAIGVTDAGVLSTFCDGVVLVMHGQKTNRFAARQALETLEVVRARILGVILNAVDLHNVDYTNYRYYYNSYYSSVNVRVANGTNKGLIDLARSTIEGETVWAEDDLPEKTAKQFFDHLIANLSEAIGPMAPLVVQDHVALMGDSIGAFPRSRLHELFERLSQEILNDHLRADFEKKMLQELQSV